MFDVYEEDMKGGSEVGQEIRIEVKEEKMMINRLFLKKY